MLSSTLKSEFALERERLNNELKTIEYKTKHALENNYKEQLTLKDSKIQALTSGQETLKVKHQLELSDRLQKIVRRITYKR